MRRHPAARERKGEAMTKSAAEERRAALVKQIAQAEAQLNLIERRGGKARARDTKRKIIVGGTVLSAMQNDPALTAQVIALLRVKVTRPADKAALLDLLNES
jgi:hypothetical protein